MVRGSFVLVMSAARLRSRSATAGRFKAEPAAGALWSVVATVIISSRIRRAFEGSESMAAVITSLYRAYCYARLLEMRGRRRHASAAKGSSGGSTDGDAIQECGTYVLRPPQHRADALQ